MMFVEKLGKDEGRGGILSTVFPFPKPQTTAAIAATQTGRGVGVPQNLFILSHNARCRPPLSNLTLLALPMERIPRHLPDVGMDGSAIHPIMMNTHAFSASAPQTPTGGPAARNPAAITQSQPTSGAVRQLPLDGKVEKQPDQSPFAQGRGGFSDRAS
jgi:hypothetical protein